ncbi:MAG: TIGR01440 family protein [Oscillospiraceae bacterium]|nr:TIGR01440 family protein [Oscillospiraceae bacterium]
MYDEIKNAAHDAITELLSEAKPRSGQIVVVGCSSSEIVGEKIGKGSTPEAANAVMDAILPVITENGLFLAAQCCEHLNRALVIERQAAEKFGLEIVAAVPKPKAGGSFATAAFAAFNEPVLVEHVKAVAGLDIGCTLIGMHLCDVAVPLRLKIKTIGEALVVAAKTRPKFIGGERAQYE